MIMVSKYWVIMNNGFLTIVKTILKFLPFQTSGCRKKLLIYYKLHIILLEILYMSRTIVLVLAFLHTTFQLLYQPIFFDFCFIFCSWGDFCFRFVFFIFVLFFFVFCFVLFCFVLVFSYFCFLSYSGTF